MNFEDIEAFHFTKNDITETNVGILCSTTSENCFLLSRTDTGITLNGCESVIIFTGTNLNPRFPAGSMIAIGTIKKELLTKKKTCDEWILARSLKAREEYYVFPIRDMIQEK